MTSNLLKEKIVDPEQILKKIKPGMSIFLSTGATEPRTMVKHLLNSKLKNIEDLELIQIFSFGDAISPKALKSKNFRLKTFFSDWMVRSAITAGSVDLIPTRFVDISRLIESGKIPIDVALLQITPPNEAGLCSLGVSADIGRESMERASLTVGEINPRMPKTFGDTFVSVSDFDFLVRSEDDPIYFERWAIDDVLDKVARNVVSVIEDGSCIAFSTGPLYEAVAKHLVKRKNLGIHSPFFTDPLMDLMKCGSVNNRKKDSYRGKSLCSYALGTSELFQWLDSNPFVEFQRIEKVFDPSVIARNEKFTAIISAMNIDLYGRIALNLGAGNVATGPAEVGDFVSGADMSKGGLSIFALSSRGDDKKPNIVLSIEEVPKSFTVHESVNMVVTEYGIASLKGRTVRERAMALIEIAHPDDRAELVDIAKKEKILYPDQIFIVDYARIYPAEIAESHTFRDGLKVRFRPIKSTDEASMRHLFYRFSEESVYYRYFHTVRSMPHAEMQKYVNVDCNQVMSIVGIVDTDGSDRIIAEARWITIPDSLDAEIVFVVDESYQSYGIATYMCRKLITIAQKRGLKTFIAEVLFSNTAMMKVFKKTDLPLKAHLEGGVFHIEIRLTNEF